MLTHHVLMRPALPEPIVHANAVFRAAARTFAYVAFAVRIPPTAERPLASVVESSAAVAPLNRRPQASDTLMPLLHLDLNLPAYRLDVFLRNERVRVYRVAIGMPRYRTPRGAFEISQIQWNPWWVPPKKEWAKNERITPPGPKNPMGKVKLPFLPLYFIHGTPDEGSLGKPSSHGCVRLANRDAIDFATLIQGSMFGTVASDSLLAIALPSLRTIAVKLPARIPVDVRYDLVELVADTLFVYADPYRLGTSPWADARAALSEAGLDSTAIDYAGLRRMARYPERTPVALPVHRSASPGVSGVLRPFKRAPSSRPCGEGRASHPSPTPSLISRW